MTTMRAPSSTTTRKATPTLRSARRHRPLSRRLAARTRARAKEANGATAATGADVAAGEDVAIKAAGTIAASEAHAMCEVAKAVASRGASNRAVPRTAAMSAANARRVVMYGRNRAANHAARGATKVRGRLFRGI